MALVPRNLNCFSQSGTHTILGAYEMAYLNENAVIFNIYIFVLCVIEENMTVVLKMIMHMSRLS